MAEKNCYTFIILSSKTQIRGVDKDTYQIAISPYVTVLNEKNIDTYLSTVYRFHAIDSME